MTFAKLSLDVDGKTVVLPCLEIMALSTTTKADGAEGYVRFYEAFDRRYGSMLAHYRRNDSTKWHAFQPKDRGRMRAWFSDARTLREPLLGITMHGNAVANEPKPPLFRMFFDHAWPENPQGMFHIVLPVSCAAGDVAELLALVDDAMAEFPVHWGTAGYSFHWDTSDTKVERCAEQWIGGPLLRHPGLGPGNLLTWGVGVEDGVANIGWLTFVGDSLVQVLGGRDALSKRLAGTGVAMRAYGQGVGLQAGPRPELGDLNRKHDLPLYREVGKILEPVFAPEEALERIPVTGIEDPDRSLTWLRRFLP